MTNAISFATDCESSIQGEWEFEENEENEDSFHEMSLSEFLEKYADLTAEQLEEVDTTFKQHGIYDFGALAAFATEDLIHHLQMSEETAKKLQLAAMKHTCFLFAELAEIGGVPSIQTELLTDADPLRDQTAACIVC